MRRKITLQILGLLLIILPVMYLSLVVFSILLFGRWRDLSGEGMLYAHASQMTINFEQSLQWKDEHIVADPARLAELHAQGIWLQVLDENGTQVYEYDKPAAAPSHYTPADLILNYKYSGAIRDEVRGYTLFVAKADRGERHFSYILGFPDQEVVRAAFLANPRTIFLDLGKVAGGVILVVTLVTAVLAYLYGSLLASPLARIIEGIQRLARSEYSFQYAESGLYASVYHNLNSLTKSLQTNDHERKRLETARDEWIANISHDLKTPLSSVRGYAELLADPEYQFSEAEVRQYAQIMKDKSTYIEGLIEDLRLTYQLKNASLPLQKKPVNLVDLLREAIIDLLNDPRYCEAPLHFDPDGEEIFFPADQRLLQRAFSNLILNALVHNPPETPITISISEEETIHIVFQDQGQGIPTDEVDHLFERYYRGTNTAQDHQSSGLGLAITREIVHAHGGHLQVHSQPGSGTRIEILFSK